MRLSVIMPGYNNPDDWWNRCVRSVLAAIGREDEVICVDDGSATHPLVLEELASEDQRIRVVRKQNGGLADARNAALEVAQGAFVTFVDSDDEVRSETFRRCLAAMGESGSDIAVYGVRIVWTKEGLFKDDVAPAKAYGAPMAQDVKELMAYDLLNYSCNKVYRTAFLKENSLRFDKDGMPCEDIIFNLSCLMAGARVCTVDYVGYVYYRVSGGRTILSSYKPTNLAGLKLGAEVWRRYCATLSKEDAALFARQTQMSGRGLVAAEWKNIWMPGTPYSLWGSWKWLRQHPELGGAGLFIKTLAFMFLRRHFYIRPIRRWHIRRMYPNVVEVNR